AGLAVMTTAALPLVLVLGVTVFTLVAGAGTRLRHRAERRGRRAPVRSGVGRRTAAALVDPVGGRSAGTRGAAHPRTGDRGAGRVGLDGRARRADAAGRHRVAVERDRPRTRSGTAVRRAVRRGGARR